MGFFAPTPHVTPHEWERVRARLLSRGFSREDIDDIEAFMKSFGKEVTQGEIRELAARLRRNKGSHTLSHDQIDRLEDALREAL